jgi:hypothetical protein
MGASRGVKTAVLSVDAPVNLALTGSLVAHELHFFEADVGQYVALQGVHAMTMNPEIERNLGEQPIARIMQEHNLNANDLVSVSPVPMTHKMVARACKGRRLTLNTQSIVLTALNRATGKSYSRSDLFNY